MELRELLMVASMFGALVGVYVALDRRVTRLEAKREGETTGEIRAKAAEREAQQVHKDALCERLERLEGRVGELETSVGEMHQTVDRAIGKGFERVLEELKKSRQAGA